MTILLFRLHLWTASIFLLFLLVYLLKNFQRKKQSTNAPSFKRLTKGSILLTGIIVFSGLLLTIMVPVFEETWLRAKLGLAALSFLFVFVGIRRQKTIFVFGSFLLFLYVFIISETKNLALQAESEIRKKQIERIEKQALDDSSLAAGIYTILCKRCHGEKGDAGIYEATNLRQSALENDMKAFIIRNGKDYMPSHKYLTDREVGALLNYINDFASR